VKRQNLFLHAFAGLLFLLISVIPVDASEWECILQDKFIECIAVNPVKPIVYVGVAIEGVYKTENRGKDWAHIDNGLDPLTWVYGIAVDPKDTDIMYVGSCTGIYKSTNAGLNWIKKYPPDNNIFAVAIDPNNTQIVYSGHYKSIDGGNKWGKMNIEERFLITDFTIEPEHTKVIYAASWVTAFILKSSDSGKTWNVINNKGFSHVAIDPIQTETIYTGGLNGLYKSIDAGKTWKSISQGLPGGAIRPVLVDPIDHRIVYTGIDGVGIFFSNDAGETWRQLDKKGFPRNTTFWDLAINPSNPSVLYAATDNGLWSLELEPRVTHSIQPFGKMTTTWGNKKGLLSQTLVLHTYFR